MCNVPPMPKKLLNFWLQRRKIRLIEANAGVYLSEAQNPITPPLTHCICVYSIRYLFTQERGGTGGELNQREGVRGNSSQSWVENTNMTSSL
jgi:hypothetical protein